MSLSKKVPYAVLKTIVQSKADASVQAFDLDDHWFLIFTDGALTIFSVLNKSDPTDTSSITDFTTNLLPTANAQIDNKYIRGGTDGSIIGNKGRRLMVESEHADSPMRDAFGRLRIAAPLVLFNSVQKYDKQLLLWEDALTGGGTSTHLPNESSTQMSVGTASGDKVVRQTLRYFVYVPGRSTQVIMTGVLGPTKTGVRSRIGFFSAENGFYFEQSASGTSIGRRSKATGSVVDTLIAQSGWNVDKFDGTGPSGRTLDPTKAQIFMLDLEWLGVGRVRMGLNIDGVTYYAHEWKHANVLDSVYMTTAKLPLRYEIENVAAAASASSMKHICSSVTIEGGEIGEGISRSISNGVTKRTANAGTPLPLLSLRLGGSNLGATLKLLSASALCTGNDDVLFSVVHNPVLTGASWAGAGGLAQRDVAATSFTGGTTFAEEYYSVGQPAITFNLQESYLRWIAGNMGGTPQVLSVVAQPISGNASVAAAMTYREVV